MLSDNAKIELLKIARAALTATATGGAYPPASPNPELSVRKGMFVTLSTLDGRLRGCMGHFEEDTPLYELAARQARMSAAEDPRFGPVGKDELNNIKIEISVLTTPEKVANPLKDIVPGRHGVIVRRGGRGGTYLPQVWAHFNNDWEGFMRSLCGQKAGLAPDAWNDPATSVERYEAIVFSEEGMGLR